MAVEKRKRGRPCKLTPQLEEKIFRYIRGGNAQHVAAQASGLSKSQFFAWMAKGRAAKSGKFRDFYLGVEEALAVCQASLVIQLRDHGQREWRAILAILARRFPNEWKEQKAVEATITTPAAPGASAALVQILSGMNAEEIRALADDDLEKEGEYVEEPEEEDDAPVDEASR